MAQNLKTQGFVSGLVLRCRALPPTSAWWLLSWNDAVSINQRDNAEKSRQVMLMRNIYASASRVRVCIGEPVNLSVLAFDTLERFGAHDGTPDGSATYLDIQDTVKERRAAIQLFIEQSYFSRMWIVQEVVVAQKATILCGSFCLDFDKMHMASRRMTGSQFYPFSGTTTNLTYVGNWRASYLEMSALEWEENLDLRLFLDTSDRRATNVRDKIYALRGIAHEALTAGIKVKSNDSVEKVYTDFSKHVLRTRPNLQILSAVILDIEQLLSLGFLPTSRIGLSLSMEEEASCKSIIALNPLIFSVPLARPYLE